MESAEATVDMRCLLDLPDHPPQRVIPSEARHNLFLAVKEAVNNVLRHAGASEIRLEITLSGDAARIVVADNGRGLDVANPPSGSTHDGLRNMRQRMIDISGTFEIESAGGKGTRVILEYPLPRMTGGGGRSAAAGATASASHE
jgi:signal transduction histidine kinase